MELSDIMALVKAGYTKDEISKMENPNPQNADTTPVPEPTPVLATAQKLTQVAPASTSVTPAQVAETAAVPVPQPVQQEAQPTMAELMQAIAKLTGAVQANAIAQSVIPGGANPQTPTAADALAEIIRPTFKARE